MPHTTWLAEHSKQLFYYAGSDGFATVQTRRHSQVLPISFQVQSQVTSEIRNKNFYINATSATADMFTVSTVHGHW
jgi:hypothetical protein